MEVLKAVKRETEKAVLNTVSVLIGGGIEQTAEIWLPKSQIKETETTFELPEWLISAKQKDLSNSFGGNSVLIFAV